MYSGLIILYRLRNMIAIYESRFDEKSQTEDNTQSWDQERVLPCHYFDVVCGEGSAA